MKKFLLYKWTIVRLRYYYVLGPINNFKTNLDEFAPILNNLHPSRHAIPKIHDGGGKYKFLIIKLRNYIHQEDFPDIYGKRKVPSNKDKRMSFSQSLFVEIPKTAFSEKIIY